MTSQAQTTKSIPLRGVVTPKVELVKQEGNEYLITPPPESEGIRIYMSEITTNSRAPASLRELVLQKPFRIKKHSVIVIEAP